MMFDRSRRALGKRFAGLALVFSTTTAMGAGAAASGPFDLDALTGLLSQRQSGEALFTETRFVQVLDAPQVSSGRLRFSAPDRFERETLQPRQESVVVDGNSVRLTRLGRTKTVSLDSSPELRAMLEAVRGTLTGNAKSLRQFFKTTVTGAPAAWTLDLLPLPDSAAGPIRQVRIEGRQDEVRTVEVTLTDGDRSLMKIEPLAPAAGAAAASR